MLGLGSVGFENQTSEKGERLIWLDHAALAKLKALRGPGESYSDVIFALAGEVSAERLRLRAGVA